MNWTKKSFALTEKERKDIGNNVKVRRLAIGISQSKLCKKLNWSSSSITRLERGKIELTSEKMECLAKSLMTNISSLATKTILNKLKKGSATVIEENTKGNESENESENEYAINEVVDTPTKTEAVIERPEQENLVIPDFIMEKVIVANINNISVNDIIVAGLNYFTTIKPEEQIHYVMTYTGNKAYYRDMVVRFMEAEDYVSAHNLLSTLQKLKY